MFMITRLLGCSWNKAAVRAIGDKRRVLALQTRQTPHIPFHTTNNVRLGSGTRVDKAMSLSPWRRVEPIEQLAQDRERIGRREGRDVPFRSTLSHVVFSQEIEIWVNLTRPDLNLNLNLSLNLPPIYSISLQSKDIINSRPKEVE